MWCCGVVGRRKGDSSRIFAHDVIFKDIIVGFGIDGNAEHFHARCHFAAIFLVHLYGLVGFAVVKTVVKHQFFWKTVWFCRKFEGVQFRDGLKLIDKEEQAIADQSEKKVA